MKLSTILLAISATSCSAFSMNMNSASGGRSKLAQQYKDIMSIHSNSNIRMQPPKEPDPEVCLWWLYFCALFVCVYLVAGVYLCGGRCIRGQLDSLRLIIFICFCVAINFMLLQLQSWWHDEFKEFEELCTYLIVLYKKWVEYWFVVGAGECVTFWHILCSVLFMSISETVMRWCFDECTSSSYLNLTFI